MLIAAKSISAGGSNKKLRSPSTMRASMCLRRIGGEVAQKAIGTAEGIELIGRHEEGVLELDPGPCEVAEIIDPLGVVGHDGVPEAEGGPGEFLGDARIRASDRNHGRR